jgi:hypothetical protein
MGLGLFMNLKSAMVISVAYEGSHDHLHSAKAYPPKPKMTTHHLGSSLSASATGLQPLVASVANAAPSEVEAVPGALVNSSL